MIQLRSINFLVLAYSAAILFAMMWPPEVFAQGANASVQGRPFEQLQESIDQGDQELQDQIDAVEDVTGVTRKELDETREELDKLAEFALFLQDRLSAAERDLEEANRRIGRLESDLAALQNNPVFDLNEFVTVDETPVDLDNDGVPDDIDGDGIPDALSRISIEGANVRIVNGDPFTANNGLGNLIVGYDQPRVLGAETCSDGAITFILECLDAGEQWGLNHKFGSHNIVAGDFNSYSQYGGVVFGQNNAITAPYSVVTGGQQSIASGVAASVSGGQLNTAFGLSTSISGGNENTALGEATSVSGGTENEVGGFGSSVSGGADNTADNIAASVSGGTFNFATGDGSSVSGGFDNFAQGDTSSVSGGSANDAIGESSTVGGGTAQTAGSTNCFNAGVSPFLISSPSGC